VDISTAAATLAHYRTATVNETVHPNDDMWSTGQSWYLDVGTSAIHAILRALTASRVESVQSVLDLPSGYGRVARHLRATFPAAEITFCDTVTEGADFCATEFGGRSVGSQADLTSVELGGPYDLIWVGSLFTHVDRATTAAWLPFLLSHLASDGVLVSTHHGLWTTKLQETHPVIDAPRWEPLVRALQTSGYGFATYDGKAGYYGVSVAAPDEIMRLAMATPGFRVIGYTERGWADNHDVLALARTDRFQQWD
jgi:SAM-dependent methyltransferase